MPQTEVLIFRDTGSNRLLLDWLSNLETAKPKVYKKCLTKILLLKRDGYQLRRPVADYLRDGIYELRISFGRVHYRIFYGFIGKNIAVLSHGTTKKSTVPPAEIELAIERLDLVKQDPETYTAEFDL